MTVIHFPRERVRDARDRFLPIIAQSDIDTQEAAQKSRAFAAAIWSMCKAVVVVIGVLGLLGFITGA